MLGGFHVVLPNFSLCTLQTTSSEIFRKIAAYPNAHQVKKADHEFTWQKRHFCFISYAFHLVVEQPFSSIFGYSDITSMGVANGRDAGDMSPPPGSKFRGMSHPEIAILKENFMNICQKFQIFQCFQNKVAEIRGQIRIWGRWF